MAGHLKKSVRWIDRNISRKELVLWLAREQIDPIPDVWMMWRWVCSFLSHINTKFYYEPSTPDDFDFLKKASKNDVNKLRATISSIGAVLKRKPETNASSR